MNLFSKLFNLNHIRHWNNTRHKYYWNHIQQNKIKDQLFHHGKALGLRNEFAQEWAELGPWNT